MELEFLKKKNRLGENKVILGVVFGVSLLSLCILLYNAPSLSHQEKTQLLRVPKSSKDLFEMSQVVQNYTKNSYYYVVSAFCFVFLLLQSFGIPGPIVLCFLSGAVFEFKVAISLVTVCSTVGSTVCYLLSHTLGRGVILAFFPKAVRKFNNLVSSNKKNLFYYLLFLRVVPLVPNWITNLVSPVIGIPLKHFAAATFVGLIPVNCIYINTGIALSEVTELGLSGQATFLLGLLGLLALIPVLLSKSSTQTEPMLAIN